MEIRNKLEKFLLSLSSVFLLGLIVLGFKVQDDQKKIANLSDSSNVDQGLATTETASDVSQEIVNQFPTSNVDAVQTTATVTPTKPTAQVVPTVTTTTVKVTTPTKKTKTS